MVLCARHQCYGYVQFEREEDAQTAISKVNGMILGDKPVTVQRYVRRTERKTYGVGWVDRRTCGMPRFCARTSPLPAQCCAQSHVVVACSAAALGGCA